MSDFVNVRCIIRGGYQDMDTECSFLMPNSRINPQSIHEFFPYEGRFHFRIKTPGYKVGFNNIDYVWLDVTESDNLSFIAETNIDIQAKCSDNEYFTDDDESNKEEVYSYLNEVQINLQNNNNRPRRPLLQALSNMNANNSNVNSNTNNSNNNSSSTSHNRAKVYNNVHSSVYGSGQPHLLNTVTEGATNLWKLTSNTVKATVTHLQQTLFVATPLSDTSESNLAILSEALDTRFDDSDSTHISMLTELWQVQFPTSSSASSFQRRSIKWKEAGWQTDDPVTDVKASGILGIQAMIYFGNKFPDFSTDRINKNKANIKTNYPYAIVGINLTLLLADLLALKDNRYLSVQSNYWTLFEDPTAFFEMFCVCFHHVDAIWTHRKAVRTDFGKITGETKAIVNASLIRGPKTVQEFKFAAADEGMMVHDLYQ